MASFISHMYEGAGTYTLTIPSTLAGNTVWIDAAPTVGGAAIGIGGAWSGTTTPLVGGKLTIPPCGAAEISFNT